MTRRRHAFHAGKFPVGTVPTPGLLKRLDKYSSEMINGDEGGTYAPASPIVFGPGSVLLPALTFTQASSEFTGDIETVKGNSKAAEAESEPPGIFLRAGVFPEFESARTRAPVVPFSSWAEGLAALDDVPFYVLDPVFFGARAIVTNLAPRPAAVAVPFRAAHHGATITSVTFRFVVTNRRAALPATQPGFRVLRQSTGSGLQPLLSAGGGADANGWKYSTAANAAVYWNNGKVQDVEYACDQNNVVDAGAYAYMVQFIDEVDTGGPHGNVYLSATFNITNLTHYRPE